MMAKDKPKLTEQQRVLRVLSSQGLPIGRLDSFPADFQKQLAKFCDEAGVVKSGAKQALDEYWDSLKATVDEG